MSENQQNTAAPGQEGPPDAQSPTSTAPLVAVHGVVTNAASGDPLPRVLVQVDGETGPGALTDGDGRFELTLSGYGSHMFQLTKPGFHDLPPNLFGSGTRIEQLAGMTHNVFVTEETPALSFSMTPAGVIHGRIDLSTGEPGQGIGVQLLRHSTQGGHAIWRPASNTRTNSDGAYRFAGLDEGEYAIATEWARESELAGSILAPGNDGKIEWNGYAALYYPDAREFSSAAKIQLHTGESLQANLLLKLEPFHLVRATLPRPTDNEKAAVDYSAAVLDLQGHSLSYPAQYDGETRTVKAMLPDGSYTLQVTTMRRRLMRIALARNASDEAGVMLQGTASFTVAGHPITNLHIALAQRVANPLVVSVARNSARPESATGNGPGVFVSVSQAGDSLVDGMWTQFAQGSIPGQLETSVLAPGAYWVHTTIAQPGLCESSFTAGGASLAREPLAVGAGGGTAPTSLTLRDDCSKLTLNLPPNLLAPAAGEEPFLFVYVVPDFDSTVDVPMVTLRPFSEAAVRLDNLAPGSYHVYTFAGPVELEYHNREALASLPYSGQAITLEPSSTSTLVLEPSAH